VFPVFRIRKRTADQTRRPFRSAQQSKRLGAPITAGFADTAPDFPKDRENSVSLQAVIKAG
jgi:hypothetical protein